MLQFFAKNVGLKIHYNVFPEYLEDTDCPILLNAKVAAFLMLPRYECAMDEIIGPNAGLFSLVKRIEPLLLAPLGDSERALFDRALRFLKLKATDRHLRKGASSGYDAGPASNSGSEIRKGSANQQSGFMSTESDEWPALMLIGSGSLEAFPTF